MATHRDDTLCSSVARCNSSTKQRQAAKHRKVTNRMKPVWPLGRLRHIASRAGPCQGSFVELGGTQFLRRWSLRVANLGGNRYFWDDSNMVHMLKNNFGSQTTWRLWAKTDFQQRMFHLGLSRACLDYQPAWYVWDGWYWDNYGKMTVLSANKCFISGRWFRALTISSHL